MPSKVKLVQLRSYQALMTTGSMSAAAQLLNVTQPALSKHLSALEEAIGLRLFSRRRGGPLTPTRAGREFFKAIEGPIDVIERLPAIAKAIATHGKSRFQIAAALPIINSGFFAEVLRQFRALHPEVRLALESRHRVDLEELVLSRQVDIAFGLLPAGVPGLRSIPLVRVEAVAVMTADHLLARRRYISFGQLSPHPLILPSRQPLRVLVDRELDACKAKFNVVLEASSTITCCKFVAEGFGVTLCDPFSPSAFRGAGLVTRPLRPAVALVYGALIAERTEDDALVESLLSVFGDMKFAPQQLQRDLAKTHRATGRTKAMPLQKRD